MGLVRIADEITIVAIERFFKGQLISECLFDALNFPKNHRKI
jgi:hypothetical protein